MRHFLVGALVASSLLSGCRGGESEQPPIHLIHNMDTQEKGKAYRRDTSGLFADGRVMRLPVEGTVARGQLNEDDVKFRGLNDKGEPTHEFPADLKAAEGGLDKLAERGAQRYAVYCAPCHGPTGGGDGKVTQRPSADAKFAVPPPSLKDDRVKEMVAGKIFAAITYGVNNGNMGSYASQIPVDDRWAIIAHIRKDIQGGVPYETQGGPAIVVDKNVASVDMGKAIYLGKYNAAAGCNSCHSLDGAKVVGPTFKGLWGRKEKTSAGEVDVDEAYVKESVLQPAAKIVEGYPPAMPPYAFNDVELQSINLFLQEQK
ncbi:MAG: Cytochrome oxidase, cbb3-type, subunit, partial [Pseudomonadota bacterium]